MADGPPPWRGGDGAAEAWLAGLVAEEAARRRAARHWRTQADAEEATLHALLVALAEDGERVAVGLRSGREVAGTVVAVAADAAVVQAPAHLTVVALAAVAWVRAVPAPGRDVRRSAPPPAAHEPTPASTLRGLLAGLAEHQPDVVLRPAGGQPLTGRLVAVGLDLVTLALPDGAPVYASLSSLDEVTVGSG